MHSVAFTAHQNSITRCIPSGFDYRRYRSTVEGGGEPNDLHYVSNYVTRRQARAYRLTMAIQVLDGDEAEHAQDEQRNW